MKTQLSELIVSLSLNNTSVNAWHVRQILLIFSKLPYTTTISFFYVVSRLLVYFLLNPCSPVPFTQQKQNNVLTSFFWRMSMQHRSYIAREYTIQWRHQSSVSNLFKVINTDTRHQNNLIDVVLVSLLQNRFHTFWCFHC